VHLRAGQAPETEVPDELCVEIHRRFVRRWRETAEEEFADRAAVHHLGRTRLQQFRA